MIISSLKLTNFRNFAKKEFEFKNLVTVVVGPNTVGKTSILEAIFYLATGKSSRADQDNEVISWGQSLARVAGVVSDGKVGNTETLKEQRTQKERSKILNSEFLILKQIQNQNIKNLNENEKETLEIVFSERKQFMVNGVARRMVDFAGICKAVLFRPEDLELITDSPSLRRRYLDFVLVQVDREYRRAIISYEKGIRQRNRLLEAIRDNAASRSQLLFWDQLLIKNGDYISQKRQEYIDFLNVMESELGNYNVVYDHSKISPARLEQYAEAEVAAGVTLVGPHRDDFKIKLKGKRLSSFAEASKDKKVKSNEEEFIERDISIYGSRGEQRLAILWLKMRELTFIEKMTEERPILLLDDIFSELDHPHRKMVMEIVGKQQTIITTADRYYIEGGKEMEIVEL